MSDFQDTGSEITSTMAGCLRGTIAVSASITISAAAGLSVGMSFGIGKGLLTGILLLAVLLCGSVYLMNNAKQLTVSDCIMPLPIGALSAFLFAPVGLMEGNFFSVATCLGASLFLTIMLFLYKSKKIGAKWLILPFLVFIYELLPIDLPTDLDNFLSLGGNGVNLLLAKLFSPANKNLIE